MLITHIRQLTPDALTAILEHHGTLEAGASVADLRVQETRETTTSLIHFLRVQYRDYRTGKRAPSRIFVKITRPTLRDDGREAAFYDTVAIAMQERYGAADLIFPVCYDAHHDPDKQQSHFLLEDLSDGFKPSGDGQPPSKVHREKIMERLAVFHAFWWEHADLKTLTPPYDEAALAEMLARSQAAFDPFAAVMRHKMPAAQFALLEKIVQGFPPRRRDHMLAGRHTTLVHRDTHPGNFLYSYNNVKLIDWQSWRTDSGMDDLAYFIACHLPDPVQRLETRAMLQRYYTTLTKAGVKDYTWEDCEYDYMASLARVAAFMLNVWTAQRDWTKGLRALKTLDELGGAKIFNS